MPESLFKQSCRPTGKHLWQNPLGLQLYEKRESGTPVNFAKFLRPPFPQNTPGQLLPFGEVTYPEHSRMIKTYPESN